MSQIDQVESKTGLGTLQVKGTDFNGNLMITQQTDFGAVLVYSAGSVFKNQPSVGCGDEFYTNITMSATYDKDSQKVDPTQKCS